MAGFSNITGDESIMFANNASFDGTERAGKLTTDGQLWIGASVSPHVKKGTFVSPNSSITFGYSSPNVTAVVNSSTVGQTITGDTGGALSPTAGNWNLLGSGSITTVGSGSTITTQLTGLTNHSLLVGAGTTTITKVAPSATSGVPLISQGASSDPLFGTVAIAGGGTNATSMGTSLGIVKYDGTSLVTSSAATLNANNIYTNTAQPALSAVLSAQANNVTGDGTTYTVLFDSVQGDQGSNYNSGTGTFTFPVAGYYQINCVLLLAQVAAGHTFGILQCVTTGTTLFGLRANYGAIQTGGNLNPTLSVIYKAAVNDTAVIQLNISGSTKVIDVFGQAYASGATSQLTIVKLT